MKKIIYIFLFFASMLAVVFTLTNTESRDYKTEKKEKEKQTMVDKDKYKVATVAGGCFWCMEPPFERLEGVVEVTSGYSGGVEINPTYDEVASGRTSHAEAVEIVYDPEKISYEKILEVFWMNIDPTQADGQFADRGKQYRTAIFYHDDEQKMIAEDSKKKLEESGKFDKPIVTIIEPFKSFYKAENYHQDYYKKNSMHYKMYRKGSGREGFIEKTWGSS